MMVRGASALHGASVSVARYPRARDATRMLVVDRERGALVDTRVSGLPTWLEAGDLVVINDAATLPASIRGRFRDHPIEIRLAGPVGAFSDDEHVAFRAVVFGAGDWRDATEVRPLAPLLTAGDLIEVGPDCVLEVIDVEHRRVISVALRTTGTTPLAAVYRYGKPIQYSYLDRDLGLGDVQTPVGSRPRSFEMPSAGRAITASVLLALRRRGVQTATLTHAAGISSTGDAELDATLPWPERCEIPSRTVELIESTRRRGGRVIAIGTTVARALEGVVATEGRLVAGERSVSLRLQAQSAVRVVDGLLTGVHDDTSSHIDLVRAFISPDLHARAIEHSAARGYLAHELGDTWLVR